MLGPKGDRGWGRVMTRGRTNRGGGEGHEIKRSGGGLGENAQGGRGERGGAKWD